jgi:hypothetical protein
MRIIVKCVAECHIRAYLEGAPDFYGEGDSPEAAIGSLIKNLAKTKPNDIEIKYE